MTETQDAYLYNITTAIKRPNLRRTTFLKAEEREKEALRLFSKIPNLPSLSKRIC